MDHSLCPENESAIAAGLPQSLWPYRRRRLKWVSLGVKLTDPVDENPPEESGPFFFCCTNAITGGIFEGHVTQKISAIHLTNIWERVDNMVGDKTLRLCKYEKCNYHPKDNKNAVWKFKETVPMYSQNPLIADIMDRKMSPNSTGIPSCSNCDKPSVGASICACNFNDVNSLLSEYLKTCVCTGGPKADEEDLDAKSLTVFGPVSTCTCCVKAEVKQVSVYLPHRGYSPFICTASSVPSTFTKYLKYKTNGPGIIGGVCGGSSTKDPNIVQTWTIDPLFGGLGENNYTCYSGPEGVFSLCNTSFASVKSCSTTERVYTCGQTTAEEQASYCLKESLEKTWTESLEEPYTLEDVNTNVTSVLASLQFDNPRDTFGSVLFGTNGNRVLAWYSGSASPQADYQRGEGGIYKSKARIKFLAPGKFKQRTEFDSGSVSEQDITVAENQIIILNPPSQPGKTYIIINAGSSDAISTGISENVTGSKTESTLTGCINENGVFGNCPAYVAPNCVSYRVQSVKTTINNSDVVILGDKSDIAYGCGNIKRFDGTKNDQTRKINISSTVTNYAGTAVSSCTGTSEYLYWRNNTLQGPDFVGTCKYNCSGTPTTIKDPYDECPYSGNDISIPCSLAGPPDCVTGKEPDYCSSPCNFWPSSYCKGTTEKTSVSTSVSETSVTTTTTSTRYCGGERKTTAGRCFGSGVAQFQIPYTHKASRDVSTSCTTTTTYTQVPPTDSKAKEVWESKSCSWGSENCPYTACANNYETINYKVNSSGNIVFDLEFEAETADPEETYETKFQTITRTDNTSTSTCANVVYTAKETSLTSTSKGGTVKVTSNLSLSASPDESNCLVHTAAITHQQ